MGSKKKDGKNRNQMEGKTMEPLVINIGHGISLVLADQSGSVVTVHRIDASFTKRDPNNGACLDCNITYRNREES